MPIWDKPHITKHDDIGYLVFYYNALLRSLSGALSNIFIPIFFYKYFGIKLAISFYLFLRIFVFLTAIPIARIIEKIHFKKAIIVSVINMIIYMYILNIISKNPILSIHNLVLIFLADFFLAISIPFYWITRFSVLTKDKTKTIGAHYSTLVIFERIGPLIGPILGAFIIKIFGFHVLFSVSLFILVLSIVPVLFLPHYKIHNNVSFTNWLKWTRNRKFSHQHKTFMAKAADDYTAGVIWPLLLFLRKLSLTSIGGIFSGFVLFVIVFRYIIGKKFDNWINNHHYKKLIKAHKISTISNAILWGIKILARNLVSVIFTDLFASFIPTAFRTLTDDLLIYGGKRMHHLAYYTYKEMSYSLSVIIFMSIALILVYLNIPFDLILLYPTFMILLALSQTKELKYLK